ncbi:hypothetical protein [Mitsuaria sp. GD03876]|uniref:hypothetical protein n=1 Tax=Mitsuaria sp. GD03876 TaxID=2975399 RepID=UPI0024475D0B|nr:hypothetical protein [Mitsuaria sp. GD03876]MDH0867108.1 hypothetical protein [Mitsuaria sp. GD03876]
MAAALAAGCTGGADRVEVTILPDKYVVGAVTSELATPAVDEVVRLKPREVHIHACTSTPSSRIIQFNVELNARLEAKRTLSLTAPGC